MAATVFHQPVLEELAEEVPAIPSSKSLPVKLGKRRQISFSDDEEELGLVDGSPAVDEEPSEDSELLKDRSAAPQKISPSGKSSSHDGLDLEANQGKKMSMRSAVANLVTCMIGASVLSLPRMVANSGWVLGPALVAFAGCVSYVASSLVDQAIEATSEIRGSHPQNIGDVVFECFGDLAKRTVLVLTCVFQLSKCGVYFVVIGANLNYLIEPLSQRVCSVLGAVICARLMFLRDITVISKWSFIGVIASGFYLLTITMGGIEAAANLRAEPEGRLWPSSYSHLLSDFAVMLYAYSPADVVPVLKQDMKDPKALRSALRWSHLLVSAIYVSVGSVAYLGWDTNVQGNVLLSMCDSPGCPGALQTETAPGKKWLLGYTLAFAVVANLMVTLPVVMYCVFRVLENELPHLMSSRIVNYSLRLVVVIGSLTISLTMPFFTEILAVISTALLTTLQNFVPVSITMALGRRGYVHSGCREVALLLLGIGIFTVGMSSALNALALAIANDMA